MMLFIKENGSSCIPLQSMNVSKSLFFKQTVVKYALSYQFPYSAMIDYIPMKVSPLACFPLQLLSLSILACSSIALILSSQCP